MIIVGFFLETVFPDDFEIEKGIGGLYPSITRKRKVMRNKKIGKHHKIWEK